MIGGDDFKFTPPTEILSVERDTWWDNYPEETNGLGYFVVKHKSHKGLIYITHTWARDELEAYTQVMRGKTRDSPDRSLPE